MKNIRRFWRKQAQPAGSQTEYAANLKVAMTKARDRARLAIRDNARDRARLSIRDNAAATASPPPTSTSSTTTTVIPITKHVARAVFAQSVLLATRDISLSRDPSALLKNPVLQESDRVIFRDAMSMFARLQEVRVLRRAMLCCAVTCCAVLCCACYAVLCCAARCVKMCWAMLFQSHLATARLRTCHVCTHYQ
jgi:hypothetical protein